MERKKRGPDISDQVLCAEYEAVYHYALSLCRNDADAQDITQETFLKAMKAAGSFVGALFSKTEGWARVTYHRAKKMIHETLRKDGIL